MEITRPETNISIRSGYVHYDGFNEVDSDNLETESIETDPDEPSIGEASNWVNRPQRVRTIPGSEDYPLFLRNNISREEMNFDEFINMLEVDRRLQIFSSRQRESNINWTPTASQHLDEDEAHPKELLELGYNDEEYLNDWEWLERLAINNPMRFCGITGYSPPIQLICDQCNECTPIQRVTMRVCPNGTLCTRTMNGSAAIANMPVAPNCGP